MSLGVMPSDQIAKKYGFHEFLQLGQAVISGDLRSFEEVSIHIKLFFFLNFYIFNDKISESNNELLDITKEPKRIYFKWNLPCS